MFWKKHKQEATEAQKEPLRCSFCNKSQRDVKKLIAGPTVYICDECVDICLDIISEDVRKSFEAPEGQEEADLTPGYCALCRISVLVSHALVIRNRGLLCPGCVGEIQATLADRERPQGEAG